MYGGHPSWGSVRMAFANDYSVQKILLAAPEPEEGAEGEAPSVGEIYLEVLEDGIAAEQLVSSDIVPDTTNSSAFSLKRKSSRKMNIGGNMDAKTSCRPVFHASPSGAYCAVHWPESMVYVILRVNVSFAAVTVQAGSFAVPAEEAQRPLSNQAAQEVDRGVCLEFGWIGTEDHYLVSFILWYNCCFILSFTMYM